MTRRDATIDGRNATADLIEYVAASETFPTLSRPKCSFPIYQTLFIFSIVFRISLLVFQVKRTFAVCVFPLSSPTTLYHHPLSFRIFIFFFFCFSFRGKYTGWQSAGEENANRWSILSTSTLVRIRPSSSEIPRLGPRILYIRSIGHIFYLRVIPRHLRFIFTARTVDSRRKLL